MTETQKPARVVFALLVVATFGAFFVTQKLKQSPRVVRTLSMTTLFSPNGDHRRELATIRFRLESRSDIVTVRVQDSGGDTVRTLASDRHVRSKRTVRLTWNGRDDAGKRVPDGIYHVRIGLRRSGRSAELVKPLRVDTTAPRPVVQTTAVQLADGVTTRLGPAANRGAVILPPGGGRVFFGYLGYPAPTRLAPRFVVYRTDVSPPKIVARLRGTLGSRIASWDARVNGHPAPPGTYAVAARIRDEASNTGTSPPLRPGTKGAPVSRPGVTIRGLALQPPVFPTPAGTRARFFVDARGQSYEWRLRRVGAPTPLHRYRTFRGPALSVLTPPERTGVYLLEVRTHSRFAQVPFAVQAADKHRPVLMVLPLISWQGNNLVDEDGNGLPNTLRELGLPDSPGVDDSRINLERPFAGDGLPVGFRSNEGPLLAFLDRARLRYDVTTDIALQRDAVKHGLKAALHGRTGVVLAGNPIWLPPSLRKGFVSYVRRGGRMLILGTQGLRRGAFVSVAKVAARNPSKANSSDDFGVRSAPPSHKPEDLLPLPPGDGVGLFANTDGLFSKVPSAEAIASPGDVANVVSAAGSDDGRPVIAALRYGKGLVIRTGIPSWSLRLRDDSNTQAVTNRAWILLGR
jgi:hypothetical protein